MPRELGSKRHNPYRVIDTWIYKVKDVELPTMEYVEPEEEERVDGRDSRPENERHKITKERIVNRVVKIELRMEKQTSQSEEPPHPTVAVKFELVCDELDIKMEGTDIEALRAAMWGCLDKKFEVKWEQYYLVQVKRAYIYGGVGEGLELVYDDVWRGTTHDGKFLLKKWDPHRDYVIKPWPGNFKDEKGDVMACIPATELNKIALKEFGERRNPRTWPSRKLMWTKTTMAQRHGLVGDLLMGVKREMSALNAHLQTGDHHWGLEDGIYRFYHHSFKVYRLQDWTMAAVNLFRVTMPGYKLNEDFLEIIGEGTGKKFDTSVNSRWNEETKPIVEAALHTHYFLRMMVKYGMTLDEPPVMMPSGWASVLYLYNLR